MRPNGRGYRGAGVTEYIVILAIVLGICLLIFWTSLRDVLVQKLNEVGVAVPQQLASSISKTKGASGSQAGAGGQNGTGAFSSDGSDNSSQGETPSQRFGPIETSTYPVPGR